MAAHARLKNKFTEDEKCHNELAQITWCVMLCKENLHVQSSYHNDFAYWSFFSTEKFLIFNRVGCTCAWHADGCRFDLKSPRLVMN